MKKGSVENKATKRPNETKRRDEEVTVTEPKPSKGKRRRKDSGLRTD